MCVTQSELLSIEKLKTTYKTASPEKMLKMLWMYEKAANQYKYKRLMRVVRTYQQKLIDKLYG